MSDEQPRPRYGEYAPDHTPGSAPQPAPLNSPPPPAAPTSSPWSGGDPVGYRPPERRRNTADVIVTVVLLVLGLVGVLIACFYAAIFSNRGMLVDALSSQGRGEFNGQVGQAPLILVLSHVVLYLLALGLSILSLVKKRIAFWIPLVAGVVAAVIFWATLYSVIASDPEFLRQLGAG